MKTSKEKLKTLRKNAEAILAAGVANREQLRTAVPALVDLKCAAAAQKCLLDETERVADALAEACTEYARAHPEFVFDRTFSVSPIGVESGEIEIEGRTFHFSHGFRGYMRSDPTQKLTQDFLRALPDGWRKSTLSLDVGGVNADKPSEEELENHGLVRKPKDTWTEIES